MEVPGVVLQLVLVVAVAEAQVMRALEAMAVHLLQVPEELAAAMDVDALCEAVLRIGDLMLDDSIKVMSLDLNPVLLDSAGKGCVVVDAVVFKG